MALQREDLVALSKADLEAGTLPVESREVIKDPATLTRLRKAKLIAAKGNKLTKKGIEMVGQVLKREEMFKIGMPLADRKNADPTRIFEIPDHRWYKGSIQKKSYVTDGSIVIVGSIHPKFEAVQGSAELRQQVPITMKQACVNSGYIKAEPTHFAMTSLDGIEVIWLKGADDVTFVPVFAPYFDFLTDKYPAGQWMVEELEDKGPVQLRVKGRGLKNNVTATVMPFDLAGVIAPPFVKE